MSTMKITIVLFFTKTKRDYVTTLWPLTNPNCVAHGD